MSGRAITLQQAVLAVGRFVHDCVEGWTDAAEGERSRMRDSRRSLGEPDAYKYSDVLFLDHPPELTGANPMRVLSYDPNGGRFVLNDTYGDAHGVPAGVHYALLNLGGSGAPYPAYVNALNLAVQALGHGWPRVSTLDVVASQGSGQRSVTVGGDLDTVYAVEVVTTEGYRAPLLQGQGGWRVAPPRTLWLGELGAGAATLNVYGRYYGDWLTLTSALDTPVPGPLDDLVLVAAEEILRSSGRPREAAEAAQLMQERVRTRQPVRWPSEVPLYPLVATPYAGER